MYIFSLILSISGTICLTIPLIQSKKNLDDDLVLLSKETPKSSEDDNEYYTTIGFRKNKRLGLAGLTLLLAGFILQFIAAIN